MKSSIELNFYYLYSTNITKFKLPFRDVVEKIELKKEYKFDLPKDLFKYNKEKSILSIKLYNDCEESEFLFFVYKGENHAYIQLDYFFRTVLELIIQSNSNHEITQLQQRFEKLDSLGNKFRQRLLLINSDVKILIDGESLDLRNIIYLNYNANKLPEEFFQISIKFDIDKKEKKPTNQFIVKRIKKIDDQIDIEFLKNNQKYLNDFFSDLEETVKKENFYLEFGNLKNKYKDIFNIKFPHLNKDSEYINDLCKNNNLTDLKVFFIAYFVSIILKNDKIINDPELLSAVLERANEDYKNIDIKNNINIDEKIKILSVYILLYSDCQTISSLNSLKIKNYIFSEKENNSIMDKVNTFFEKFIESLSEESNIFYYLLQLNSGIGYFKKEKVYTFDLTNLDMLKKHLRSLFPKSLTIYNFNGKEDSGIAFCSPHTGGIALNEIYLVPKEKYNIIDYNSSSQNISENESNEIAMNIILYLFHEYMGHKKFHNSDESNNISPKKIVRNNQLIELKHENEFKNKDEKSEYILTSNSKKGDSGHFLELCYNKFNNKTIFKLLISLKSKGKLIKRPDFFINLNDSLEKYVILKKISEEKEMALKLDDKMSIEDEINYLSEKINIEKYLEEEKKKEEKESKEKSLNQSSKKQFQKKFFKGKKKYYLRNIEKNNDEESYEEKEGEDIDENDEEKEKEENIEKKKMKRILKKFNFKNDEELLINVEKKLSEKDLSEDDYKDLNYLYLKLIKFY